MTHKKNNNKDKSNNVPNHMLIESQIADFVKVLVPEKVSETKINQLLLSQYLLNKILNKRVRYGMKFTAIYLGNEENFQIIDIGKQSKTQPIKSGVSAQSKIQEDEEISFVIKEKTKVYLDFDISSQVKPNSKGCSNSAQSTKFYGNSAQLNDLINSVKSSLFNRSKYLKNGLDPLKGILVTGFSGTGKSSLVSKSISLMQQELRTCKEGQISIKNISSINLLSKVVGGAEQYIHQTFTELKQKQPSILVIEDLHLLFSKKQIKSHTTTLAALLSELDKIYSEQIIVIGTSNSEYDLVNQIKGNGKFEKQVQLNLPNHQERLQMLKGFVQGLLQRDPESDKAAMCESDLQELKGVNLRMNGFSIGEIKHIIRQAYSKCQGNNFTIQQISTVLKSFKPAQIKELIVEVPQVFWKDIGGYENVKSQIKKVTELPLKHPEAFKKFGIQPIKGIMLYGPPGCSKTMMAKAIATESKLNFIGVKGPQLFSKYVGDSEKAVRNIFKRARACSPCIIFFDEIDAIASQRSSNTEVSDRVLCQLLNEMDGIEGLKQVIIIAATNRPQILDNALMRPGRFDYMVYISPPDLQARQKIFKIYLKKSQTGASEAEIEELSQTLAGRTQGYTGAQISIVCRQGALMALEEDISCQSVKLSHYQRSVKKIRKRLSIQTIEKYTNFEANLKY